MNTLKIKINSFLVFCLVLVSANCFAQQGNVTINQDKNISTLLSLKKELNKDDKASDRYKIQIYNGNRAGATSAQKEFHSIYGDWHSKIVFDTPNFKIWAGNFRTRLEADRALKRIKRNFPSAFIFKPKSKKNS
ncbi:SPOR domain-containing protein [Jejuia spongiicola]|uniref:SPOR domain-containing protein n=1 Tax=Jejuia spongiicola TaxID=2942207 RepID=A0ABT0QEE7_9FLAO|nr:MULTISPECIES: SPOR domain-containing protein [Flavobacteriaceae]MCL6295357.1 SPOR domain-containing protein [Jejuia spongiicola]PIA81651.1 translation initiation factor IF-2 [Gaetbulibacter sp. 4G1]